LSQLRQHYRHRIFTSGARDIHHLRDVYESLSSTTAAAEDAIAAAFAIAGAPTDLAVMALGRLGSSEFDLLSDADLLFVCEEGQGLRLLKSAERMMQALQAYTRDGMLFSVDARLRPRGAEGELLLTPPQLAAYCRNEAQPWEALTYTKLRFVAGSRQLAERTTRAAMVLFDRFAEDAGFAQAVREMRHKLDASELPEKSLKTSPGAVYDIDFLSAFLLVRHRTAIKGGTLRDRLWRCAASGLLNKADSAALDHAAELLRTVDHVVRLVVGRPRKWLPATEHARRMTETLASQTLRRPFADGLESELLGTFAGVREIFDRVVT
jgi:glutamate-ammonia-ligase adenylyltransferase